MTTRLHVYSPLSKVVTREKISLLCSIDMKLRAVSITVPLTLQVTNASTMCTDGLREYTQNRVSEDPANTEPV